MYLSKEHPPKIRHHAENRQCGQGKTLPHKRKKLIYGMKDSQETMTKVIDGFWVLKDPTLRLACDIHAAA
jgi:hypothetical protein